MSSKISTVVKVKVKNGDALQNNRTHGSSNTGTYFFASGSEFDRIDNLLKNCNSYQIDPEKVKEYQILFKEYYFRFANKYPDNMRDFDNYCDTLIESCVDYEVGIGIRKNDNRYFLRFENNNDAVVNDFRHILYGDLTSIVLEFTDNICKIYPIISTYNAFDEISVEICEDF